MIWHIFKKDFRLLWYFAAGVAVLGWLGLIVVYQADHGAVNAGHLLNLVIWGQILSSGILVATAVQLDAIPGVRQDWLVRPILRRDLLLAKLLFTVVLVGVPVFVGDVVEAMSLGIPLGQALRVSLVRSLCLLVVFYIPVLAFASIMRNLTESIVGVVIGLALLGGVVQVMNMLFPWYWRMFGQTGVEWVPEDCMLLVAEFGALVILAMQYYRRRTVASRWLTAGIGVLCILCNFIPWQSAFAIQQRLSPQPGSASDVELQFQSGLGRFRENSKTAPGYHLVWVNREEATRVFLPIRISGLAADRLLKINLVTVRLVEPDGKSQDLGFGSTQLVSNDGVPQPGTTTDLMTHQGIAMPALMFNKLREKSIRLELNYSLTLLRFEEANAMPALNGEQTVPAFGRCETKLNKAESAVQVRCLMKSQTPPCAKFFIEQVTTGTRNPEVVLCDGEYSPFNMQYVPDALRRANITLSFRDTVNRWHAPVDGPQLRESRVVMRFYQPMEYFTRHVSISDVRLQDWLPL